MYLRLERLPAGIRLLHRSSRRQPDWSSHIGNDRLYGKVETRADRRDITLVNNHGGKTERRTVVSHSTLFVPATGKHAKVVAHLRFSLAPVRSSDLFEWNLAICHL